MKVADLQQFFVDMSRLLQTTDAKKAAVEISRIAECLQSFREYDLGDFGTFLARADEYARTGVIPVVPSKRRSRTGEAAKPKADHAALRAEVLHLYGAAGSSSVTLESIEALRTKLGALTKPDLLSIAETIDIVGMKSKTKPDIQSAIISRIRSIKQSSIRTSIIDRPERRH
jgi:hypothetical protein